MGEMASSVGLGRGDSLEMHLPDARTVGCVIGGASAAGESIINRHQASKSEAAASSEVVCPTESG